MSAPASSNHRTTIRKAFTMAVAPGKAEEYITRHKVVWPELIEVLKSHGVHNYSIFYHATTRQLFAYLELEDAAQWQAISETQICKKWWTYMSDIMPTNEDLSPASTSLQQVFYLE